MCSRHSRAWPSTANFFSSYQEKLRRKVHTTFIGLVILLQFGLAWEMDYFDLTCVVGYGGCLIHVLPGYNTKLRERGDVRLLTVISSRPDLFTVQEDNHTANAKRQKAQKQKRGQDNAADGQRIPKNPTAKKHHTVFLKEGWKVIMAAVISDSSTPSTQASMDRLGTTSEIRVQTASAAICDAKEQQLALSCKTCGEGFASRNSMFRHLQGNVDCQPPSTFSRTTNTTTSTFASASSSTSSFASSFAMAPSNQHKTHNTNENKTRTETHVEDLLHHCYWYLDKQCKGRKNMDSLPVAGLAGPFKHQQHRT